MLVGELFSFLAAFCWAIAAILYKRVSRGNSVFTVNIIRTTGAIFFFAIYMLLTDNGVSYQTLTRIPSVIWLYIFLSSLLAFLVGDSFYILAISKIGVSRAMPIASIYPIFVIAFSSYFLMEKVTVVMITAAAMIVLGISLLSKPQANSEENPGNRNHWIGVLLALLANFMWTASIIMLKVSTRYVLPIPLTFIRLSILVAVLWFIYFIWYRTREKIPLSPSLWLEAAIAGLLGTTVGTIFFTISLKEIPASIATPISSTSPFMGTVLAILFLKEKSHPAIWTGALLTTTGIIMFMVF